MSKQKADIRLIFSDRDALVLVASVKVEGHDVYVMNHDPFAPGKTSHHASGRTHGDLQLAGRYPIRHNDTLGAPLATLTGLRRLHGIGGTPRRPAGIPYTPKLETRFRRNWIIEHPEHAWGLDLWVYARGQVIACETVLTTRPWPTVPIKNSLVIDWLQPNVALTFWEAADRDAYSVVRYQPSVKGYTPFEIFPEQYEGTALQSVVRPHEPDPFRKYIRQYIQDRLGTSAVVTHDWH